METWAVQAQSWWASRESEPAAPWAIAVTEPRRGRCRSRGQKRDGGLHARSLWERQAAKVHAAVVHFACVFALAGPALEAYRWHGPTRLAPGLFGRTWILTKRLAPLSRALLLIFAGFAPAAPREAPANLRPTRDVVIDFATTLRAEGRAEGRTERMTGRVAWLAAEDLVRIETQGVPGWTLLDRKGGGATMVMDDRRTFVPLPPGIAGSMLREIPSDASFSREGTDTVAGHACVRWRVALPHGDSTLCLTGDGVMLRWAPVALGPDAPGAPLSMVEATAVSYRAQDPARFRIPAGYAALEIPGFGAPGAGLPSPR